MKIDNEKLKKRLRYQGKHYIPIGQQILSTPNIMTQAEERIQELEDALESITRTRYEDFKNCSSALKKIYKICDEVLDE